MSNARGIRSICVVGDGVVGRSAALAFASALPQCRVEIIATPAGPSAMADRLGATLPSIRRIHAMLGIDERELVARSIATHSLGMRFEGWSSGDAPWILAHGDHGLPAGGVAFHQLWVRAIKTRKVPPFHAFALGAMLAQAGKFVHPRTEPGSPLGTFDYGLRLDPDGYAALLAERLVAARVQTTATARLGVERSDNGTIAALVLDSGQRIEADLFIDCSGPQRLLVDRSGDAPDLWQDWSTLFPFDRIGFDRSAAQAPEIIDTVCAQPTGWQAVHTLTTATIRIEAGRASDGADGVALAPGRMTRPWRGNLLAIGDAAIAPDPLLPVHLSLAHNAIERALMLLPGRDFHSVETDEYNRLTMQESDRVRDFAALFYLRSGRSDGVWADLAALDPPPSLALTLDQFETRGRLPFFEQDIFDRDHWLAALIGLGIMPARIDPATGNIAMSVADAAIDRLAASYAQIAQHALPYPDYLAQMRSARSR